MIEKIFGIILILFGIWFALKNKEDIFQSLKFNVFEINKLLLLISILLIILGIFLILW